MKLKEILTGLERRDVFIIIGVFSFLIAIVWIGHTVFKRYTGMKKMVYVKRAELKDFERLAEEYRSKKAVFDYLEKRLISPKGNESPVALLEDIGKRTGIKEKITMLKPVEEKMLKGYIEKGVEMRIDSIDLNQLINLLYKIENHNAFLIIKRFSMKNRFDNPDLLDITLNITLINKTGLQP
jgi:general secretion pathway protein M